MKCGICFCPVSFQDGLILEAKKGSNNGKLRPFFLWQLGTSEYRSWVLLGKAKTQTDPAWFYRVCSNNLKRLDLPLAGVTYFRREVIVSLFRHPIATWFAHPTYWSSMWWNSPNFFDRPPTPPKLFSSLHKNHRFALYSYLYKLLDMSPYLLKRWLFRMKHLLRRKSSWDAHLVNSSSDNESNSHTWGLVRFYF